MTGQPTGHEHRPSERERRVDCSQALARLGEFLDAEIDDAAGDEIRRHLAACESCLSEYGVVEHIKALLRRSCVDTAPAELRLRIRGQLTVLQVQIERGEQPEA